MFLCVKYNLHRWGIWLSLDCSSCLKKIVILLRHNTFCICKYLSVFEAYKEGIRKTMGDMLVHLMIFLLHLKRDIIDTYYMASY